MTGRNRIFISSVFLLSLVLLPSPARLQEPKSGETSTAPAPGELAMPVSGETATPEQPAARETPQLEDGKYTIRKGDTLWDITNAFLKDPFLWPLVWKANPYITNPDLIYPGNKLAIPSISPIERAMEKPEEKVAEEKAAGERMAPEGAYEEVAPGVPRELLRPKRPAGAVAPEAEEAAPKRRLILPEEAPIPVMDKYSMLNAGFVADVEESENTITGSLEPKTIYGYDDVVYITVRAPQDVNTGDRFIIYEPLRNVKHPVTGETYGTLIKVLGILQITAKDSPDFLTARITLSFDASAKGDRLSPYQEPALVYNPPSKDMTLSGYILEVVDGRTLNAQTDIVYLDKGSMDGVEPGDRFVVYVDLEEGLPRKLLGEVQVFLVKEHTSTAVVRKSVDTLAKGDKVEYKK